MELKSKILKFLKPIQIWMQRLGRREPLMTEPWAKKIESLVMPGDIVLSFEYQRLTSWFIPGEWDHAAIISARGSVVEAVGDKFVKVDDKELNLGGVKEVPLAEWLYKKDHVAVLRPVWNELFEEKKINYMAGANALLYKGQSYDYAFTVGNEEIYCSELVWLSYQAEYKDFFHHINREILPQDYMRGVNKHFGHYTIVEILNTRKEQGYI